MNAARIKKANEIFQAVADLPDEERESCLAANCSGDKDMRGFVEQLLSHDANGMGGFLCQPVFTPVPEESADAGQALPQRVGGYAIIRKLGEGGMGVVYEARQEHPSRRVAIKIVQPGLVTPQLVRRFEHEAQFLARMKHPGIAQIYEAGIAQEAGHTRPYFAMEFVEGTVLTEYAAKNNLSLKERAILLTKVCDAAQHAHQKGIIHRDLKPANILVDTTGQPKVLDFGVARATDADIQATLARTSAGQLIGTLGYMSPEQVSGDQNAIDTRSDVYALGVIAYELLTGQLPYDLSDKSIVEAARIIQEVEPSPPATIDRAFSGDLQVILLHALDKDPDRRYQTASDLAADLLRFLRNEPIAAKPATAMYQFHKLVARHKLPAALVAALFILVSSFAVGMGVLYTQANANLTRALTAEKEATKEAVTAERVKQFLVQLFEQSNPSEALGNTITVREMLDAAVGRIERGLTDEPVIQASLMNTMGVVYQSLGLYVQARPLLDRGLELSREHLPPDDSRVAAILTNLGDLLYDTDDLEAAEILLRDALAIYSARDLGEDELAIANCLNTLGGIRLARADNVEAESLFRRSLDIRRKRLGHGDLDVAATIHNLGQVLMNQGKYRAAEQLLREALAIQRTLLDPKHPSFVMTLSDLAVVLVDLGNQHEAESLYREAMAIGIEVLGRKHPQLASTVTKMGRLAAAEGDYDRAERLFHEAISLRRNTDLVDDRNVAFLLNNLGATFFRKGNLEEAERAYLEALSIFRTQVGENHPGFALTLSNLGGVLMHKGEYNAAETVLQDALEIKEESLGPDHPSVAFTLDTLGEVWAHIGNLGAAEAAIRRALSIRRKRLGDVHHDVGQSLTNLGELLYKQGDSSTARETLRQAIEVIREAVGVRHPSVAFPLVALGEIYVDEGDPNAAEPFLAEAVSLREEALPNDSWELASSRSLLGACFIAQGRLEEAEPLVVDSFAIIAANRVVEGDMLVRKARQRIVDLYQAWGKPDAAAKYGAGLNE